MRRAAGKMKLKCPDEDLSTAPASSPALINEAIFAAAVLASGFDSNQTNTQINASKMSLLSRESLIDGMAGWCSGAAGVFVSNPSIPF